jgi:hypothetical protein
MVKAFASHLDLSLAKMKLTAEYHGGTSLERRRAAKTGTAAGLGPETSFGNARRDLRKLCFRIPRRSSLLRWAIRWEFRACGLADRA